MNKPVFSIITPTLRRPELLKRNIRSIRNQTFENYEHIIVDDGNSAETAALVEEFGDSRIRVIKHDSRKGAAASYNSGIKASKGNYILFLDDDDEYLPCFLRKMYGRITVCSPDTGFIWTGISRIRDTGNDESVILSLTWPSLFPDREQGLIAATSIGNGFGVCVRKECFDEIGLYDESLEVCEDTDLLFRLAEKYKFETVPEVLVKIHQHANSQLTSSGNFLTRIRGKEIILDRHRNFLEKHPLVLKVHYKAYADLCYQFRMKNKARKAMISVIKKFPLDYFNLADFISYELSGREFFKTSFGKIVVGAARRLKRSLSN